MPQVSSMFVLLGKYGRVSTTRSTKFTIHE